MINSNLPSVTTNQQKLKKHYFNLKQKVLAKHQSARDWLKDNQIKIAHLNESSRQMLAAASLASTIAFNNGQVTELPNNQEIRETVAGDTVELVAKEEFDAIVDKMKQITSRPPGQMEKEEELYLEQQLSQIFGFEVAGELDGNRLNHTFGIMGGEQHLRRFQNDTLSQHDAYQEAGIAPNRGAFGWFTENGELTPRAIDREKYYFAVQTLYLPDWNNNHTYLKDWYKFRKMIAINPYDGKAVVGVVGDAGPALWVQKQFGGSPEVIREGMIWSKEARGRVILLFVDDREDKVPLGVINLDDLLNSEVGS